MVGQQLILTHLLERRSFASSDHGVPSEGGANEIIMERGGEKWGSSEMERESLQLFFDSPVYPFNSIEFEMKKNRED